VTKGDVKVSQDDAPADCIVHGDKALFDGVASGETNLTAARLRGDLGVDGDVSLLINFQRLLPAPADLRNRPRAGDGRGPSGRTP